MSKSHPLLSPIGLLAAIASSLAATPEAMAQQLDRPFADLQEVTVTATRRETSLQDTPIAITALSAADIDMMNPRDVSEVWKMAPGFSAARITAFNAASFAIRGVGQTDIIVYLDAPVSVIIDDFVQPSVQTQLLDPFDIEQVEILRGPQGTSFGKNTTGGAVTIRTKRPSLDTFGGNFEADAGSFGRWAAKLGLDVPIVDGIFAMRFVGSYVKSDGYYKNDATWGPVSGPPGFLAVPGLTGTSGAGTGEDLGGEDSFYGRVKALWQINDDLSAFFQYENLTDRSEAVPSFNDTDPSAPYLWNFLGFTRPTGDPIDNMASTQRNSLLLNMGNGQQIDVNGYYLNVNWNFSDHTFTSVTGYRDQEERLPNTYTGAAPLINGNPFQPFSLFDATRDTNRDTFQQEFRIASNSSGPFNYVGGLFYQSGTTTFCVLQVLGFLDFLIPAPAPTPSPFFNNSPQLLCNSQDQDSWAAYGDVTYQLNDKWTLGAGLRYSDEEKEWTGRNQVPIALLGPGVTIANLGTPINGAKWSTYPSNPPFTAVVGDSKSWSDPSWRATVAYQVNPEWNTYFKYDYGFRSGAYNDQTGTSGQIIADDEKRPTDPEYATSFEIGSKLLALDNRLRFNAAIYYVEYEDAQRALNATVTNAQGAEFQQTLFFNAADATDYGVELEAQWLATDSLTFSANFTWQEAEYDFFQANTDFDDSTTCPTCLPGNDVDLSGLPITRTPEVKGGLFANYDWTLGNGSVVTFVAGVSYEDEQTYYYSDAGRAYDATLNAKTLVDASVMYTAPDNKWYVKAYGKNLTDERYRIASQSVATLWTHSQYGEPVSWGVVAGVNFGGE
jgi:iron complex outermembrane receptor protein